MRMSLNVTGVWPASDGAPVPVDRGSKWRGPVCGEEAVSAAKATGTGRSSKPNSSPDHISIRIIFN